MGPLCTEEEYQNNPKLKREDIANLKDWLIKQPHLPDVPEEMLIMFLHACDYKLEPTKHAVESHYMVKTHCPEVWSNRDPLLPEVKRALQVVQVASLPRRDADGNLVLVCRLADTEPAHFVHQDTAKVYAMFHDLALWRAGLAPGVVMVLDQKGAAFGIAARINISVLRKHLAYLQDGFPGKITKFHLINCMPVTEKLLAIAKPFLKSDLLAKLSVHSSSMESLYKCIPKEILPNEYGGSAGTFEELHKMMVEEMKQNRDWFLEEERLRVDESKVLAPDKFSGNTFGIVGSFKKLDID